TTELRRNPQVAATTRRNQTIETIRKVSPECKLGWEASMMKRIALLGLLASILPGCAHNRDWMLRQPPQESTLGTDFKKAPAGQTIRPPGMGVDLGDRSWDSTRSRGIDSFPWIRGTTGQLV